MESSSNMKNAKMFMWQLAVAAALPAFAAGPVQAGFEWSPPPAAPAISSAQNADALPPVPASPAGNVEAMELMPIPGTEAAMPSEALPQSHHQAMPVESAVTETSAPVIERETPALTKPVLQDNRNPPPATGPFAVAQGFGADIPLALALGQIVPPEYAYSFASNVNPGLKISWDGGKPWNVVLNDALAVHDLRAEIAGTAVVVRKGVAPVAAPAPAPVNTHAVPVAESLREHSSITVRPPMDQMPAGASADASAGMGGEGSANYPRRQAPKQNFFQSIFTPEEQKGNQAPRPPIGTGKVTVRNGVSEEELGALNVTPAQGTPSLTSEALPADAAAVEPAAPAVMAPLPVQPAGSPIPLNTQKISYADEDMRQRTDILPERNLSESVRAQANVLDPFQVSFWQADNNANLREVLTSWAQQAGVEVIWDSGYDYKLPGSIALHGTFPEAVTRVFDLYGKAEPRPQGKLHPNLPKGPSVLLVENFP